MNFKKITNYLLFVGLTIVSPFTLNFVHALEPQEVIVIANDRMTGSVRIAQYYMQQRNIPKENLLIVSVTTKETILRKEFNEELRKPLRKILYEQTRNETIQCLVTVYGIPLRVSQPALTKKEKKIVSELLTKKASLESSSKKNKMVKKKLKDLEKSIVLWKKFDQRAAVDSELSLVLKDQYALESWLPNPYYLGNKKRKLPLTKNDVLMVSRLDGPDQETVFRIIDDSLDIEKVGLRGKACFDARYSKRAPTKKVSGYTVFDEHIHDASKLVSKHMPSVLESTEKLFSPGECQNTALYCGWYSLGKYIDSFNWQKGSIGYHIASSECSTLKAKKSEVWCKKMLEKGVAATIGPVYEPYVQAFPPPDLFFSLLLDGYLSLVESYFASLPHISWQMILIGDPLYTPFKPHKG